MFGIQPVGIKFSNISFRGNDDTPPKNPQSSGNVAKIIALGKDVYTYTVNSDGIVIERTVNLNTPDVDNAILDKQDGMTKRGHKVLIRKYERPDEDMQKLRMAEFKYGPNSQEFKEALKEYDKSLSERGKKKKQTIQQEASKPDATLPVHPSRNNIVSIETAKIAKAQEKPQEEGFEIPSWINDHSKKAREAKKSPMSVPPMIYRGDKLLHNLSLRSHYTALDASDYIERGLKEGCPMSKEILTEPLGMLIQHAKKGYIKPDESFIFGTRSNYTIEFSYSSPKPPKWGAPKPTVYKLLVSKNGEYVTGISKTVKKPR